MSGANAKMQKFSAPAFSQALEPANGEICPEPNPASPQQILPYKNARPRLLLFDPDPQDREAILHLLPADSYERIPILTLSEIRAAVSAGCRIDGIVMNLETPLERWLDLVSYIKEIRPKVAVILISRLADEELWIESIQRGAYDLLSKPLEKNEFLRVLRNALEKYRSE